MSTEANKATIRRIPNEIYNQGQLAVADEVFEPEYIEHTPLPPGFPTGVQAVKAYAAMLRAAFPDLKLTVEDEVAEGDRVVMRITYSGTQTGEFMGIPATGKRAVWTQTHICRLANGRLAEHWVNADQLGMMQQLGVIPTQSAVVG